MSGTRVSGLLQPTGRNPRLRPPLKIIGLHVRLPSLPRQHPQCCAKPVMRQLAQRRFGVLPQLYGQRLQHPRHFGKLYFALPSCLAFFAGMASTRMYCWEWARSLRSKCLKKPRIAARRQFRVAGVFDRSSSM